MSKVKNENFVAIQGWMVTELGLKGNSLLIYAIIYGFSQAEGQVFTGSLQYLADWTNSTKQGVLKNLKKLIDAVRFPEKNYSQLLLSKVPQQYEVHAPTLFGKIQAVLDHMSAMTDVYALDLYRKLNGMSLPAV